MSDKQTIKSDDSIRIPKNATNTIQANKCILLKTMVAKVTLIQINFVQ